MKISLFTPFVALIGFVTFCGATPQGSGNPGPSNVGVPPPSKALSIVYSFDAIRSDISSLLQLFSSSNPNTKPDFLPAEKVLMQLGKDIDATRMLLDGYSSILSTLNTDLISNDLKDSVMDVKKIVAGIIALKDYFQSTQTDTLIVSILRALTPGFHRLYKSLRKKLYADARTRTAAMILDIICTMDQAIEALQPGNGLCTPEFCSTYDTYNDAEPNYHNCPDKAFPDMPKPTGCFDDCDQSCSSMLKFGYENNCYDGVGACDSKKWCDKSGDVPFEPCTNDWSPQPWFCEPPPILPDDTMPDLDSYGSDDDSGSDMPDLDTYGGGGDKDDDHPTMPNKDAYGSS